MIRHLLQLCVASLLLASAAAQLQQPPCAPAFCGNVTKIRYPFYIPALQASNCGRPGFELNCTDLGLPIFRIPPDNHEFVVESISDADPIFSLYDAALLTFNSNITCLPEITNTTLPTPRFRFVNTTRLHLFPLCLRNVTVGLGQYRVICDAQDDDQIWNLAMNDDDNPAHLRTAVQNCGRHIVAPVNFATDNIYSRLRRGYQLRWTAEDINMEPSPPSTEANFGAPPQPLADKGTGSNRRKKVVLAVGASVATLTIAASFILLVFFRKKLLKSLAFNKACAKNQVDIELFLKNHGSTLAPKMYKYSHIKKITNSFSENLGKGGYGTVYKGKLQDGRLVAVKILSESKGNGEEFINEVSSISRTSHVNVVALLGFCFDGSKRALIYEFMPNGSLEKFMPNSSSSAQNSSLGVEKLFEIVVGIARGLEYLHQGCNTRILHFDIKPHNILLDKDFKPKISDFGLSKLCPNRSSIVSMQGARGTVGYIAPEVFCRNFGEVSHKSDVYSYGMMVLDMAVGRQHNIDPQGERSSAIYFSDWIYKNLEQNTIGKGILDSDISQEDERNFIKRRLIIIGLWCIQTDPKNRPSISGVIEMLEAKLESLQLPPRPCLSSSPILPLIYSGSESNSLL